MALLQARFSVPLCLGLAASVAMCFAQQRPGPAQPAPPQPASQTLPAPSMTGPLQLPPPITFNAGPFGTLDLTGVISGIGLWQGNPIPGDSPAHGDLSNGQLILQKTDGWWQFYLQAGVYDIPILGSPFLSSVKTNEDFWGPLPVGYLKLAPTKTLNILIGQLPTVIGAESTFTFQNINIERGLLWNQENAVNRGIQVNDTFGKLTASISWNDGFYSDRYTWLSGSMAYAFNSANTLSFDAGGNFGRTAFRNLATPVQNNGSIYNIIYTYTKGNWIVHPYYQYSDIPTDQEIGILAGSATQGGALLVNYSFKRRFSLSGRGEYISSSGTARGQNVNLLFGPGSAGWSATITPTFQDHGFFIRGEFSIVGAANYTPGDGLGALGLNRTQSRGVLEAGFLF